MIVELDDVSSSFWMVGSCWLHRGSDVGVWHRFRMEDREDKGICVRPPDAP